MVDNVAHLSDNHHMQKKMLHAMRNTVICLQEAKWDIQPAQPATFPHLLLRLFCFHIKLARYELEASLRSRTKEEGWGKASNNRCGFTQCGAIEEYILPSSAESVLILCPALFSDVLLFQLQVNNDFALALS